MNALPDDEIDLTRSAPLHSTVTSAACLWRTLPRVPFPYKPTSWLSKPCQSSEALAALGRPYKKMVECFQPE